MEADRPASGSSEIANHAAKNVHNLLISTAEFEEGRYEDAIKIAFAKEDKILLQQFQRGDEDPLRAGTTVALCYLNLTRRIFVTGNLGDSHIIMAECSAGQIVPAKMVKPGAFLFSIPVLKLTLAAPFNENAQSLGPKRAGSY
jgi:hypothetical protein